MVSTRSYHNCCTVEKLLMQDITRGDISPNERAALAKALDTILDRKRILRMKPMPKAIDVPMKKHYQKPSGSSNGPVSMVPEPSDPAPSAEPPKST